MKIVYLGSGQFGIPCLNALAGSDHTITLIVTQPPQPAGRGRKTTPTPVAKWAKSHSQNLMETDNINTTENFKKIASLQPDIIIVIAFGQKISNQLINLPPKKAVNVHASLLPKYRGAAPINWAIINGQTQTGITIITLAEKIDAGNILAQKKTQILPQETAEMLHNRLAEFAAPMLLETIDRIADGTATYAPQDHSQATAAPRLKKSDGFLGFNNPADSLERKIRGLWPWPGASAVYISKKTQKPQQVTIAMAQVVKTSNPQNQAPGTLDQNLNVICGQDSIKIIKIKPQSSRTMDFTDFVNGRNTQPGDIFTKIHDLASPDPHK